MKRNFLTLYNVGDKVLLRDYVSLCEQEATITEVVDNPWAESTRIVAEWYDPWTGFFPRKVCHFRGDGKPQNKETRWRIVLK